MQSNKLPITVLVQTKNEEVGIARCLNSLVDFDEVIVVDSNSSDATSTIAQTMNIPVVNFTWNRSYPKKKQWQLENVETHNDWILFLDADEFPTPELLGSLRRAEEEMKRCKYAAYDIELDYVFSGETLQHGHRVIKRALVNRHLVRFPVIDDLEAPGMGELEGHYQPETVGLVGRLSGRIKHDDQDPVRTWFERHNRYSDWEAFLRTRPGVQKSARERRSLQGRLFDLAPFKPLIFFGYSFILKRGFLDGRAGFDYAFALSSYYWQIGLKVRERKRLAQAGADFCRDNVK